MIREFFCHIRKSVQKPFLRQSESPALWASGFLNPLRTISGRLRNHWSEAWWNCIDSTLFDHVWSFKDNPELFLFKKNSMRCINLLKCAHLNPIGKSGSFFLPVMPDHNQATRRSLSGGARLHASGKNTHARGNGLGHRSVLSVFVPARSACDGICDCEERYTAFSGAPIILIRQFRR
jgi:hypothetical protein